MNCARVHKVLDAYLDKELDDATNAQLASHVRSCPGCSAMYTEREALGQALQRLPRHTLPERSRGAIADAINAESYASARGATPGPRERFPRWRSVALAAASAGIAFLSGFWVASPAPTDDAREPVVARHVASLRNGVNLVQVTSTDRHVVKPWFSGRVDFAPPVRDLQANGFALIGGRLDHVAGRDAAALVYRIREHDINLFVWRIPEHGPEPVAASALHGFSVVTWAGEGLGFAAVSDVDSRDLQRFTELFRAAAR